MENNNGKGIFYGVIGVATLVVAIIGATFAYFSATVTPSGDAITGGTNDNIAGNMTLTVNRLLPSAGATATNGLVPANIDGTNTLDDINAALTDNCVDTDNGYVGCHVYKITASSSAAAGTANINLKNLTVNATTVTDWHYAIYTASGGATTASDAAAGALVGTQGNIPASNFTTVDMHNGAAMTAGQSYYYYLIIYLTNDTANSQNDSTETGSNTSQTGTYSGEVELQAAGGHVSATFGT